MYIYIYIKLFTYIYKNTKRLIYSELNTYKYLYTHKKSRYNAYRAGYTAPFTTENFVIRILGLSFAMGRSFAMAVVAQRLARDATPGPKLVSYATAHDRSHAHCIAQAPLKAADFEVSHIDPPAVETSAMTVFEAARCVCFLRWPLPRYLENLIFATNSFTGTTCKVFRGEG